MTTIGMLLVCAMLASPIAVCAAEFPYPGPRPGPAEAKVQDSKLTLGNAVIAAEWALGAPGLRPVAVTDLQAGSAMKCSGELFQVELADGTRYSASGLKAMGTPRATALAPRPAASRLADRAGGQRLEVPLLSDDGRLKATWSATLRDDANYLRLEVVLEAVNADLRIKTVTLFDQPVAGARTAGAVDGSPIVAGSFFLGFEDPMAANTASVSGEKVGEWSPADLVAGEVRRKTWALPPHGLAEAPNQVLFRYERGDHRLDIHRVALLENGREVAADAHHGHTGTRHVNNTYVLNLPKLNPAAEYALAAELGTDPEFKVPPDKRVDSYGAVLLLHGRAPVPTACRLARNAALHKEDRLAQSLVIGVAPAGQMRRAFLYYVEHERAHPYRPFLHYNAWYDICWTGAPLNDQLCLEAVRSFGENLIKPHGVVMDSMVIDDGWDDPKTLWQFNKGFPNGFASLADLCKEYGTRAGTWLSPFGGYGAPKEERLRYGRTQGYEINASGFSLAGPQYYARFKSECLNMIRKYGVNHFKFDGIASGMYASGAGGDYVLDTEAMRRLMLELRQEDPNLYINLTTGSWPSPFWLFYADSVWRQGEDSAFAGKGTPQQQWLTYRDKETFKNIVGRGPLYPLNSLMTQGVMYSRYGNAAHPGFNSAGLKEDIRAFFGSGTGLQELYIMPGKLKPEDWKVLAESAKWARANADVLVDTHWIGGDPAEAAPYGWASWTLRKGILALRNPDDKPRAFALDVRQAFELPAGAPERYRLHSPWAEDAQKPALAAEAGTALPITLQPFEILIMEAEAAR
ncbi:MAG: hypothetical protein NTW87_36830 [Planctomycetota bacterium]|nr:hypothetical protein [Planctomycetota bacterium]